MMSDIIEKNNLAIGKLRYEWYRFLRKSFYYSIISHIAFVILIQILTGINFNSSRRIYIREIKQIQLELREVEKEETEIINETITTTSKDTLLRKIEKPTFAGFEIDTTEIVNRYEENTLNVSILFPINWIYYDNKVKDIIDGVIFIPTENSQYDRRLSVMIQVNTNKRLFNTAQYDSSFSYNKVTYYITKPRKILEEITQIVYIRTGAFKADFIIKLTSPNEAEFQKFKPVFFAMVRSFSAGY